jgi:TRAP-type C4-dicarboxylate transport system permease small subunit
MGQGSEKAPYRRMDKLNMCCVYIASVGLFAIAALTTVDVILRYCFLSPVPAAVEICGLITPYVILLPFAFTLAIEQHVRVGLLTCRFPARIKFYTEVFALLLVLATAGILAYYGAKEFADSYAINEFLMAPIILPAWAGKFAQPVGWGIFTLQCIVSLMKAHAKYKTQEG